MQLVLTPHPTTPPADADLRVWASVDHVAQLGPVATTNIWFGISLPPSRFVIAEGQAERADDLWKTTCFEAFVQAEAGEAYREWNFAPAGQWAAYDFAAYRERADDPDVDAPYVRSEDNFTWWSFGATITLDADTRWRLGLSAVLEEADGTKSYWSLVHPDPARPDFHHRDCFAATLA